MTSPLLVFRKTKDLMQARLEVSPSAMPGENGSLSEHFCVAIYYAARSYVEVQAPAMTGATVEIAIPLSSLPRQLAVAVMGDRLRIQFRSKKVKPSPMLNVVIIGKQKDLGRHVFQLEVLDWDKLARYWRIRTEEPGDSG